VFVLVVAAVAWWIFRRATRITLEDALITYRYAENLAAGRGPVFNVGERVLGTTSPLFALLLAVCGRLVGIRLIPACSNAMMALAALGSAIFAFATLRRMTIAPAWCALAAAFTLLTPDMLWVVAGGMETPLVLLLMAWSFWASTAGRWAQVGVASALLCLARADGALWVLVMLALCAWQSPRGGGRAALTMAIVLLPWMVFAFWYFGSPVPQSIAAKFALGPTDTRLGTYLRWFTPGLGAPFTPGWGGAPLWVIGGLIVLGVGSAFRHSERRPLLAVAGFVPLYFTAMWLGHAPRTFAWYLVPPAWCSLLLAATGLGTLYESLVRAGAEGKVERTLANAAAAAVLAPLVAGMVVRAFHLTQVHRDWQRNQDGLLRAVGVWIDQHAPRDASVAMEAIGYEGTYSHRRVIDLAGLVTPRVVQIRRAASSNAAGFNAVLDELHPEFLVLRSFEVDRNLLFWGGRMFETRAQADSFASHYQEAQRFEAPVPALWGPMSFVTVFRRYH
jgi:hypothetical protein